MGLATLAWVDVKHFACSVRLSPLARILQCTNLANLCWTRTCGQIYDGQTIEEARGCGLEFGSQWMAHPIWASFGLIPFFCIWLYVALLLLLLLCNSSNFNPYVHAQKYAQCYIGSDVTSANIMSVGGLCVATMQLSMLIFSYVFDVSNSFVFQLLMLHSSNASVNWRAHGILAGLILGVGAEVLRPLSDPLDQAELRFLNAVYHSSLILPFIYIPMFFNLLIGLKSNMQDGVAGFAVALAGFVVFSLCTGWARIQLDCSGKQVLTPAAWFVNVDYALIFLFVFLAHTLSACPEWFFWVALGLMLAELGVIWRFRPFARTRGNILKASSCMVLCIVTACAIALSKGVSPEWVLGIGIVALAAGLVCIALSFPCVKHRVTFFVTRTEDFEEMTQSKIFFPIAYFVEFLFILLVPIWSSQDCSGLQTWAIISDVILLCWVLTTALKLKKLDLDLYDVEYRHISYCCVCFLILLADFALGVWLLVVNTPSPFLYVSSILLVISVLGSACFMALMMPILVWSLDLD